MATLKLVEIEEQIVPGTFQPEPITEPITEEPAPNNPPWNSLEAVGVWVASVLFILIVPTFFLLPYLATQRPPITESAEIVEFAKSDPTALFLQIVAVIPAHLLTVVLAWFVVTRFRKFGFRKMLGWETGGLSMWLAYPIILGGFFVIAAVVGSYFPEQENDLLRILKSSRSAVYIVAFVATFTAPFVEEVVYRGILYSAFQRTFGTAAGFLFVTLLFALVHVPQYYPSYSTIFLLTLLSVILTLIRVKTKNLLPCIILHALFNGLQSFFLIIEPMLPKPATPEPASFILYFLQ
ncbi:MAG: type II CAAX endopeptidase family protein [Pyrinomonadaceae bacterium]